MPKAERRRALRGSEKVRRVRWALGLTQEELTEQINKLGYVEGLERSEISDFERGKRDPDSQVLLSYAYLANVHMEVLVDDGLDLPEELPSPYAHPGIKHVEPDKKSHTQDEAVQSITVTLQLEIKSKNKLFRGVNRARANIERYHLRRFEGMRKLKDGGYELKVNCKNKVDMKEQIDRLLKGIEEEAARDNCIVEAEVRERNGQPTLHAEP